MRVKGAIFSFTPRLGPDDAAYLRWHLLDHMPEQFRLPGILHGVRWIADDALAAVRIAGDDGGPLAETGSVVGYLYADTVPLADRPRPMAVIRELYVEPDGRDVGIGEALMDGVLAWAREQGCDGVDSFALPGNRALKNLFERYGLVARAILVHRPLGGDP